MTRRSAGDRLWVWQEQEPDGKWGTIAALVPSAPGPALLVTRSEEIAKTVFQVIAEGHNRASDRPVRLAQFDLEEVHAFFDPA